MRATRKRIISMLVSLSLLVTLLYGLGGTTAAETKTQTWTGWIIDRDCLGVNPVNHSKMCNLMDSCYASGLGIYLYGNGGSTTISDAEHYLVFDGPSKILAKNFLNQLPETWKKNITVKITGYTVSGIPANAEETNVPETDPAKAEKQLDGIHITSIEAAAIEGISTNELPSPNAVVREQGKDTKTPAKAADSKKSTIPEWAITVTGAKSKAVSFTSIDYVKLKGVSVKAARKCGVGECKNGNMQMVTQTWSGVTLKSVLDYLGIKKYKTITVIAKDKYSKNYLPAQVNLKGTILATKVDGKKLDGTSGPVQLVVSGQAQNLWVRNVIKIVVNK